MLGASEAAHDVLDLDFGWFRQRKLEPLVDDLQPHRRPPARRRLARRLVVQVVRDAVDAVIQRKVQEEKEEKSPKRCVFCFKACSFRKSARKQTGASCSAPKVAADEGDGAMVVGATATAQRISRRRHRGW